MRQIAPRHRRTLGGALGLVASLCAAAAVVTPAAAQPPEAPGETLAEAQQRLGAKSPLDSPLDEPVDFSMPPLGAVDYRGIDAARFTAGPSASTGWDAKVGLDYRAPASPNAAFRPDRILPGAPQDQSTGVAWANVTAPGLGSPWSWDQASIETRLDPEQEGKLGMTLSRSLPVGSNVAVTLQNSYSMTQALAHGATAGGPAQIYGTNQAVRFNFLPIDTTLSVGAALSSTDDKWLRSLSAEQKLFGGPVSVTGSVSESSTGEFSKSLKAGFKRTW
jgi:hypothetical protein